MCVTPVTLFVACYGKRGSAGMDTIYHALRDSPQLALHPDEEDTLIMFINDTTGDALEVVYPVKPNDTMLLRLDMPIITETRPDWAACRCVLEGIISHTMLSDQDVWGYTLVYVAEWQDDVPAPDEPLSKLLLDTLRLGVTAAEAPPHVLAHTAIAGGHMGLFAIPADDSVGYDAANIYGIAVPAAAQSDLVVDMLFGSGAAPLIPDLLAHKGSCMMRQYRADDRIHRYKVLIEKLHHESDAVLQTTFPHSSHAPTSQALFDDYVRLMRVVPSLKWLRSELTTQRINSELWQQNGCIGNGEIESFHLDRLKHGELELAGLIAQGEDMLGVSSRVVGLVQVQQQQEQAAQQEDIIMLFTILGVALAITQFITADVAADILQLGFGISITEDTVGMLVLLPVGVQIIIITIIGSIAWVVVARRQRRGRG